MKILFRAARHAWTCPNLSISLFPSSLFSDLSRHKWYKQEGKTNWDVVCCVYLVPDRAWTMLKVSACGSTPAALRLFCWHLVSARGFCDGYLLVPPRSAAWLPFLMHNFLVVWNLCAFWTNGSSQHLGGWFIFSHLHLTEKIFLEKILLLHVCSCLTGSPASICLMQRCAGHTRKNSSLCKGLSLF